MPNIYILGEFMDNSWDWGSTKIVVSFEANALTIEDDGAGCIDMQRLLTLGKYLGAGRTGRFGLGLKQASYTLGPELHIESASGDKRVVYDVNWPDFTWRMPKPKLVDCAGPSFMRLRVGNADVKRLAKMQTTDLRDRLRLTYYPALKAGRSIIYGGHALSPVDFPELSLKLRRTDSFQGGRYNLTAGLFRSPQKTWPHGFNIAFRDRLMVAGMKDVYGDYDPHGFFAYLELIEDSDSHWNLNLNKNGIENQVDLAESLFPVIEPLLKRAQQRHEDVHDRELISKIEAQLNAALGGRPRKAKRQSPTTKGSERKKPERRGGQHQHAARVQSGNGNISTDCDAGTGGNCTGYRISFNHEGPEIASVDLGAKQTFVRFFVRHPAVSQWRRGQEHRELFVHAYGLILAKQRMHRPGQQMALDYSGEDPFQDYVEKLSVSAARAYEKVA
jgi:hypothetical protein